MLPRIAFLCLFSFSLTAFGQNLTIDRRIHDEIESAGGNSIGLGQGGMAAVSDVSSVRLNPSMLALESNYSVYGSYHWPTFGRDFYQAGIVDSKTSGMAAGLLYTGFNDDFNLVEYDRAKGKESTLHRRLGVGVAQVMGKIALGLSVFFIEGFPIDEMTLATPQREKMTTFGLGASGYLTPQIRFGVSAENLANKKMPEVAPRFLRAGLAYLMGGGNASLHLDYINRQRIRGVEFGFIGEQNIFQSGDFSVAKDRTPSEEVGELRPEQMLVGSFSLRVYDLIRILGSYGSDMVTNRQSLSAGVAIVNQQYSLSYATSRPYMSQESSHQSINLGVHISL